MHIVGSKNLKDGQKLWYCKLDLHEVTYVNHSYNKRGHVVSRFPPDNIQCFSDMSLLFETRKNAINSLIKRIEEIEGITIAEHKIAERIQRMNDDNYCINDENNYFDLKELIDDMESRLTKLEQVQKKG